MANSAAHRAITASSLCPSKFTMFLMVIATVELSIVMARTPRKLNAADIKIAACAPMHRVETQVAIALGASVQPLTKITQRVRNTETAKTGF